MPTLRSLVSILFLPLGLNFKIEWYPLKTEALVKQFLFYLLHALAKRITITFPIWWPIKVNFHCTNHSIKIMLPGFSCFKLLFLFFNQSFLIKQNYLLVFGHANCMCDLISPTWNWTHASCIGSREPWPLDQQEWS